MNYICIYHCIDKTICVHILYTIEENMQEYVTDIIKRREYNDEDISIF